MFLSWHMIMIYATSAPALVQKIIRWRNLRILFFYQIANWQFHLIHSISVMISKYYIFTKYKVYLYLCAWRFKAMQLYFLTSAHFSGVAGVKDHVHAVIEKWNSICFCLFYFSFSDYPSSLVHAAANKTLLLLLPWLCNNALNHAHGVDKITGTL